MTHPAKGIRDIIAAAPGSLLAGWTAQLGNLPDVDKAIGFMDSGGRTPEVGLMIDYPSVQLLVRGKKGPGGYEEAYAKCEALRAAIIAIPSQPSQYPALTSCVQLGHIVPMGLDENDRPRFSMNFNLITEQTPVGYRVDA